jgi:glutathione S-transferase
LGLGGIALDRRCQFCQGTGPILQGRADAVPADRAAPDSPQSQEHTKIARILAPYPGEQAELAIADIKALATLVGDKAFVLGEKPCGADATVFAFVASFLTPVFETPIRTAAERHANLIGYRDRVLRRYFEGRARVGLPLFRVTKIAFGG